MRPWEGIHFSDELMDGFQYREFRRNRKRFVKAMDGICASQMILCTHKLKVNVSVDSASKLPSLMRLLEEFQKDSAVVQLNLKSTITTPELVQSLMQLLQCDARDWSDIRLQLAGMEESAKKELQELAESKNLPLDLMSEE